MAELQSIDNRFNRTKTGVIVIDYDYPQLIHTIVIVIVIECFLRQLHISVLINNIHRMIGKVYMSKNVC